MSLTGKEIRPKKRNVVDTHHTFCLIISNECVSIWYIATRSSVINFKSKNNVIVLYFYVDLNSNLLFQGPNDIIASWFTCTYYYILFVNTTKLNSQGRIHYFLYLSLLESDRLANCSRHQLSHIKCEVWASSCACLVVATTSSFCVKFIYLEILLKNCMLSFTHHYDLSREISTGSIYVYIYRYAYVFLVRMNGGEKNSHLPSSDKH